MNGNKKIGFCFIGNLSTVFKLHKHIGSAGINYFYVFKIFFNILAQFKCYRERHFFFFMRITLAARIFSAVPGIDYNYFYSVTTHTMPISKCQ